MYRVRIHTLVRRLLLLVLLGGGISPSVTRALTLGEPGLGISQGSLVLHPRLAVRGYFDDNIFLTDRNRKSDLVGVLLPGIALEFPWAENLLVLDYLAALHYFRDYPQENHQDHRLHGRLNLLEEPFALRLEDTFVKTSGRENTEHSQRIERIENTAKAALLWTANRVQVQGAYENYLFRYRDRIFRPYNHIEHRGILTGFLRVAPKTNALLEYTYNRILYSRDRDRDGHYNEVRAGLVGELTARLKATTKIGYQSRNYRRGSIWDDYQGLVGYLLLEQEFSPEHDLRLAWERKVEESTFAGNSHFLLNRVAATYSRQLARKLRGFARLQYSNFRYPRSAPIIEKKRRDQIWEPQIGLRYQLQSWLAAETKYTYRDRDSTYPRMDYSNHRLSLELSMVY